ncbi:MAG: hypothetical protein WAN66_22690 [Limnoraphis robusta]|uniref:Uncharacterized protein n=1 Tax=Limnoraphis robusta CS-951 TaxID=1637645 RepID=A0A0F5YJW0_9CYAN|nr:hypothetical protein [Limnoraphis robusta]KKD39161.1 hypothetical protein WN50_04820 [Limnoraphis robusta CS-951]MEA5500314.1 hypothetical protein [Limnoraphis robusta BA-68 BA1]
MRVQGGCSIQPAIQVEVEGKCDKIDARSRRNLYCGCEDVIPNFDENGNLPPGVHFCEWEEFVERFGTNDLRLRLMSGLRKAMEQLKIAGCRTIYQKLPHTPLPSGMGI